MSTTIKANDDKEVGRLQFFFHSPSSDLPIRDVLNEQGKGWKTEPHIEIGAENYISCCGQPNICGFLNKKEKYLFLFTWCKDSQLKELCIVGYIEKKEEIQRECNGKKHRAVKGCAKFFRFEDAFSLNILSGFNGKNNPRQVRKKLDSNETQKILDHFEGRKEHEILKECIREIIRLEDILKEQIKNKEPTKKGNKIPEKKNHTCRVLRGENCDFKKECPRGKLYEGNAVANRN